MSGDGRIEPPLGRKVAGLARTVPVVSADDPVAEVAARMTESGSTSAVVRGEVFGIVTDTDLRARVLGRRRGFDLPVGEVMTSPAITVSGESTLGDAMAMMLEGGFQHLPVVTGGEVLGMIDARRLLAEVDPTPLRMGMGVVHASSGAELALVVERVPDAVEHLLSSGMSPLAVLRSVSAFWDAVTSRAIELAGQAPGAFAWMVLGSQARREQGLSVEQAHALVVGPGPDRPAYLAWAEKVVNILEEAGIPRRYNGTLASDPKWCRDPEGWARWISERLGATEPRSIMEAASMIDARFAAGDPELGSVFAPLRERVAGSTAFMKGLAAAAGHLRVPLGLFGRMADRFDIEEEAIGPVTVIARAYGLAARSSSEGTIGRLDDAERFGEMSADLADLLREGFEVAQRIRLEHQLDTTRQGGVPDNRLQVDRLTAWEETRMKEVFRAVKDAQSALEAKF